MDAARVDYRDIVWALGLVTDVVRELGDSRHAVNAAIHMSMEPVAEMLRRFADPVDEDADLASWGYMRVETPEGIGFIGRGIEPFEPSLDMVAVAGRIAGAVDRDTYRVKSIEAATDLATVWLPGAPPRAVDGVLERCRGVVTINAELLPEHPNSDHQQFTAFLVEAATSADATSLCEWSTGISSIGHVSVAVQRDALLCLVVARSVVQGVDAHESAVAISRFEEPLSRALAGPV